jgi:hypothetical protein
MHKKKKTDRFFQFSFHSVAMDVYILLNCGVEEKLRTTTP